MNSDLHDDVAALALGVLPPGEAERVRRAILADSALLAEYNELRATADAVGFAGETGWTAFNPAEARQLKRRILASIDPSRQQPDRAAARPAWLYPAIAAAVAGFAILTQRLITLNADMSATELRLTAAQGAIADVAAPDAERFRAPVGEVVRHGSRLYLVLRSLPKVPQDHAFQAWTEAHGGKTMAPSVVFRAGDDGGAVILLPVDARSLAAVALSIEPESGSAAPTTTPIFIIPLG